ncbi:hypothetical protein CF065_18780 [Clostridium sporogenes]
MALKKICSKVGCTKIVVNDVVYCDYHQKKWEQKERKRYKEYQNRRRKDKEQKKYQDFYNDKSWKRIRTTAIADYYSIDILEYYRTGRIVQGERVHHIKELEEEWNSRLDINNLIYLTEQNHRRVHEEYNKGNREKKKMQDVLFALVDRWFKDFG